MPNRNAYFGLELAPAVTTALETISKNLKAAFVADGYEFDVMDPKDLHCTVFFFGEGLRRLPSGQLAAWHAEVTALISEADLRADHDSAHMRYQGLDIFPPGKHNLVVARFKAST